MEYVYGALLLHKMGQAVTETNLKKVIESAGKNADESKIKVLVASLRDVDIDKELETVAIASSAPVAGKPEEAKVEKKKEEKASEAAEGLSALFG